MVWYFSCEPERRQRTLLLADILDQRDARRPAVEIQRPRPDVDIEEVPSLRRWRTV